MRGKTTSGSLEKATLLVLLPRSARARVVPSHLRPRGHARLARGCLAVAAVALAPPLRESGRGRRATLRGQIRPADAHLEELLEDHVLQVIHHLLEHVEGFLLVLGQRITLPVAAKADAFLQVVHVEEMILPELIDAAELAVLPAKAEEDPALEAMEEVGADLALALLVEAAHGVLHHGLEGLRRARLYGGRGLGGQAQVELAIERLVEPGDVPVVRVHVAGGEAMHRPFRHFLGPLEHALLLALTLQDVAAEAVDDLSLLVHHVVVFEEVLADLEVARLHALLGGADGPGDQLVLDRLAFLHAEPLHDALDALGPEDAEEVVLEGEVEARGARIALAAGAPAELVVDAA